MSQLKYGILKEKLVLELCKTDNPTSRDEITELILPRGTAIRGKDFSKMKKFRVFEQTSGLQFFQHKLQKTEPMDLSNIVDEVTDNVMLQLLKDMAQVAGKERVRYYVVGATGSNLNVNAINGDIKKLYDELASKCQELELPFILAVGVREDNVTPNCDELRASIRMGGDRKELMYLVAESGKTIISQ